MKASRNLLHGLSRSQRLLYRPRATRQLTNQTSLRQFHPSPLSSLLRPSQPKPFQTIPSTRFNSSSASSSASAVQSSDQEAEVFSQLPKEQQAAYELTFTCKPCTARSTHRVSKHGYHNGTVLITCPNCKNRHVIADHLKIFMDKRMTLEDILKEKGATVKKGHLGTEGDVEFWDDGTKTDRVE